MPTLTPKAILQRAGHAGPGPMLQAGLPQEDSTVMRWQDCRPGVMLTGQAPSLVTYQMSDLGQMTQALGLGSGIDRPRCLGSWTGILGEESCLPGCCRCHLEILASVQPPSPGRPRPLTPCRRRPSSLPSQMPGHCSACRGQSRKLRKICSPGIQPRLREQASTTHRAASPSPALPGHWLGYSKAGMHQTRAHPAIPSQRPALRRLSAQHSWA